MLQSALIRQATALLSMTDDSGEETTQSEHEISLEVGLPW